MLPAIPWRPVRASAGESRLADVGGRLGDVAADWIDPRDSSAHSNVRAIEVATALKDGAARIQVSGAVLTCSLTWNSFLCIPVRFSLVQPKPGRMNLGMRGSKNQPSFTSHKPSSGLVPEGRLRGSASQASDSFSRRLEASLPVLGSTTSNIEKCRISCVRKPQPARMAAAAIARSALSIV